MLAALTHKSAKLDRASVEARELEALKLTVKYFGYDLARSLAATHPIPQLGEATYVGLESKVSTQADIETAWMAHWCAELKVPIGYQRKLWEYGYVLQALQDHGMLRAGARALGFGCGVEPLPSMFAERGIDVTVTDLPPSDAKDAGWAHTNQHAGSLEQTYYAHLASRESFDRHVSLRYVDMNAIDPTLREYDFCWSVCAYEHLGSIEQGLTFLINAMDTLKAGGVAVHTTEFNFSDEETIDHSSTVLFQSEHFVAVAERLRDLGHIVAPLNFDLGNLPMDKFIDVPPYAHQLAERLGDNWGHDTPQLKLTVGGFPCTCFGLIIKKGGEDDSERVQAPPITTDHGAPVRIAHPASSVARDVTAPPVNTAAVERTPMSLIQDISAKAIPASIPIFELASLLSGRRVANEARIRGATRHVILENHTALAWVLGRYKMYVDTRDRAITPHLIFDGYWEMWITEAMVAMLRPGMVAADIGANLGYFTLLMADLVGSAGKVHAFEPNPEMANRLDNSLFVNGLKQRVDLHRILLGRQNGEQMTFNVSVEEPGGGAMTPMVDGGSGEGSFALPTYRLDSRPDWHLIEFAKIDVEGAEEMVWDGAEGLMASSSLKTIMLEFVPSRYADAGSFIDRITACGFSLEIITPDQGIVATTREAIANGAIQGDLMLLLRR